MISTFAKLGRTALANLRVLTLGAHNWPESRGPTRQGHSPTMAVPFRWNAPENVGSRASIPGGGWFSPGLVNIRLDLTTGESAEGGKRSQLTARCPDAWRGRVRFPINRERQPCGDVCLFRTGEMQATVERPLRRRQRPRVARHGGSCGIGKNCSRRGCEWRQPHVVP